MIWIIEPISLIPPEGMQQIFDPSTAPGCPPVFIPPCSGRAVARFCPQYGWCMTLCPVLDDIH